MEKLINDFFTFPVTNWIVVGILTSMLIWASITDIKYNKVYHKMDLLYLGLRIAVVFWYPITLNTLIGGAVGFALLFIPAFILNTSHMAGDIKFAGVLGVWIGGLPVLCALLIATVLMILTSAVLRKGKTGVLPYAPFISIGCIVTLGVQAIVQFGMI